MPELPEVEVLVRHLGPLLRGKRIDAVNVRRSKVIRPATIKEFTRSLLGARFAKTTRRGKYLLFELRRAESDAPFVLVGHLGMTGRMYLQANEAPLPKHAAVVLRLGHVSFVFEDTRYFGRLSLEAAGLDQLGPEPLGQDFTAEYLAGALSRSRQPIKVKLLDQSLVAGVGNIYASEALFRAGISPRLAARNLKPAQVERLRQAVRDVLAEAIELGSTVPLNWAGVGKRDRLFYYGQAPGTPGYYEERLQVYDRAGQPCVSCRAPIQRLVQAARSTFFCPHCQAMTKRASHNCGRRRAQ